MTAQPTGTPAARAALQRATRRPTGKPSWPILLIAGAEKAGKSWACAQASASDLVGRTLWIGIGEDDPDEYGNVPGADFEIVQHDGTYRDILAAIEWATTSPQAASPDGRPVLVVVDSMTRLWDLLCDHAQEEATERARRKAAKENRPAPEEGEIHMDLWNRAKDRWGHVVDLLRAHKGPSLLTARLEEVTVMVNGQPAKDGSRQLKVKTEKSLPYDVGGIVQMPERGKAYLTGVRTTRMQVPEKIPMPGFTVDGLWRKLGLHEVEVGERAHSGIAREPGEAPAAATVRQLRGDQPDPVAAAAAVAVAALKCRDRDKLVATWGEAKGRGLLPVPVGAALPQGAPEVVGLEPHPDLDLGSWLVAVGKWVPDQGGLTVDDVLNADATPDAAGGA